METNNIPTTDIEKKILEAAQQEFLEKGFANSTTTEIANRAGCNQSLVHYYFRTKENLFQQVFIKLMTDTLSHVFTHLTDESLSLTQKIRTTINLYFNFLARNPRIPFFILGEMVLNRERRIAIKEQFIMNPLRVATYMQFCAIINKEIENGNIRKIEPFDLLLNIMSLTASTFISLPLYADLLDKTAQQQQEYVEHRKEVIINLILKDLKNESL
ncbi:MAG: TetR/AcrR family transcriptional regulator [Paludibacteraceae bacterium]|nr:TetR/AcrR family transcriptional regulator [Paludibacteraceae bacterium]